MKLYSDFAAHRTRQVLADLIAIALLLAGIVSGIVVHGSILAFGSLGAGLQSAGTDLESTMTDAADRLGSVPLIGDGIRAPFDQASAAGSMLAKAGGDQQALVAQVALIIGLLVTVVPVAIIMRVWMVRRLAFARRAAEARRLVATPGGMDVLALRAIGHSPAAVLAVHPDPAGAWRRGETAAVQALARLELAASGIRIP